MSAIEENSYEWAEFNLPAEAIAGPSALSPLGRNALAKTRKTTHPAAGDDARWSLRGSAAILGSGLLLGP
ncbi:MAG TPA: hypothetical protein VJU83_10850 [Burkholderiales bacterium]|nr:hypothetical protein [Burkholderiales bacterium]